MTNVLLGSYPDVFQAGAAFAGVPFACFAQGSVDSTGWNSSCANGDVTMTGPQWGNLVRNAYPGFSGKRPRVQLWHGTADATVSFHNFGEEIKEWTNVLGVSETATTTENNAIQSSWIRTRYADSSGTVQVEAIQETGQPHNLVVDMADAVHFFGLDGSNPVSTGGAAGSSATGGHGGGGAGGHGEGGAGGAATATGGVGGTAGAAGRPGTGGGSGWGGGSGGGAGGIAGGIQRRNRRIRDQRWFDRKWRRHGFRRRGRCPIGDGRRRAGDRWRLGRRRFRRRGDGQRVRLLVRHRTGGWGIRRLRRVARRGPADPGDPAAASRAAGPDRRARESERSVA